VIEAVYKNSNRPITPKDNRSKTPTHGINHLGNYHNQESFNTNNNNNHNRSEAGLAYKETFENAN